MPKITAPTVAEHRVAQRGALVAAAKAIIAESGVAAITPRSVCERAGLARSSFYEYFPSKDDLLAAIAMQAFDEWAAELEAAIAAAAPGRGRLHAYVAATIRMTADGKHSLATGLQQADLSPKSVETIMAMHDALTTPLRTLLEELRIPNAVAQAALVQGVINAGMQLVGHGVPPGDVIDSVNGILDGGVQG
ncbi:TetR/AcrR family transcriptional regulator [Herbiconiux sp. CPCC 205763]|uniref:TetR/AcrR family transcriptional regulator n=1 Tax=Herbiconiux aconitum TaxID=2970913 RepID=A0ABT2GPI3_9MICO|nr:TetR/AcrR family transcriptional regulator [Herbiconiux aconitum]MCS5718130.1 TetR/AcrR family transcriptional regulator [Herbiconiux aconitum]